MANVQSADEPRAKKVRKEGSLKFLTDLKDGEKIPVEFYMGQPCKDGATKLSHYVGWLAKDGNVLPLSVFNWRRMPSANIERAIREVKHMFKFPENENIDPILYTKLNDAWKKHKSKMKKKGFSLERTKEENLANRPSKVLESQWGPLVEMWHEEENQEKAAQNVQNILQQKVKHNGGSKPHIEYARELEEELGRCPERLEIFGVTHLKKQKTADGEIQNYMEPMIAELYSRMLEYHNRASEPGSEIVLSGRKDAVSAVFGDDTRGRVRCLGNTVKPKDYWGEEPSTSKAARLQIENDQLKRELAMKDKRIQELETEVGTMHRVWNEYVNYAERRPELPPNSNNEGPNSNNGLMDLLMDVEGNYARNLVGASNDDCGSADQESTDSEESSDSEE